MNDIDQSKEQVVSIRDVESLGKRGKVKVLVMRVIQSGSDKKQRNDQMALEWSREKLGKRHDNVERTLC